MIYSLHFRESTVTNQFGFLFIMLVLALTPAKITCKQLTAPHRSLDCSGNTDNSCLKEPFEFLPGTKSFGDFRLKQTRLMSVTEVANESDVLSG